MVTIREGKFYRDGVPEPPIFGDPDQVEAMNRAIKNIDDLKQGVLISPSYEKTIIAYFLLTCVCGSHLLYEKEVDGVDDIESFNGDIRNCKTCQRRYDLSISKGELIAKLFS